MLPFWSLSSVQATILKACHDILSLLFSLLLPLAAENVRCTLHYRRLLN